MDRILGVIASILILIGLFCPIIKVLGISVTYFDHIKSSSSPDGFIFLGLGLISLVLALFDKARLLLATGILTLGCLGWSYLDYKSKMTSVADANSQLSAQLGTLIQWQWGWAVMILGGILLLVAGMIKKSGPLRVSAYGARPGPPGYAPGPPPQPPYNR
jgi:hypothetical protein